MNKQLALSTYKSYATARSDGDGYTGDRDSAAWGQSLVSYDEIPPSVSCERCAIESKTWRWCRECWVNELEVASYDSDCTALSQRNWCIGYCDGPAWCEGLARNDEIAKGVGCLG